MIRRLIPALLFPVLLLSAAATFAAGRQEAPSGVPLTVGILPDVDSIPLVIADIRDWFREAGAEVELVAFQSPMTRDGALQAGKLDGAVSDLLAAAFARNAGFDVKAVSSTDGAYRLLVSSASGVEEIGGLAGRSVAMSLNTIIEYTTDRMLAAAGFAPDLIEKRAITQIPLRLEMLREGKIDAATLPEPLATAAVDSGARVLASSSDLGINPGVLLFTGEALREKTGAVRAFFAAYDRAVAYLASAPREEYIDELIRRSGLPPAVRGNLPLPEYRPARRPPEREVGEVTAWMLGKGLIAAPIPAADLLLDDTILSRAPAGLFGSAAPADHPAVR